jgi:peptidoglycan/xylan/chitin deacetylase (PgdA/CDA1 family)
MAPLPAEREWIQIQFYHWVLDDQRDAFRRQLRFLRRYGEFISLDDTVTVLQSGTRIGGSYFCVTFDDGFRNCFTNAVPVMKELEVPAAFFIPTKYIGLDLHRDWEQIAPFYERSWSRYQGVFEFLDWDQCRQIAAAGFEVGSHTRTHVRLTSLTPAQAEQELALSKEEIQARLRLPCKHFCCPWGKPGRDFDPTVHPGMARRLGYASFLSTEEGVSLAGDSAFHLRRTGCDPEFSPAMVRYSLRPPLLSARRRFVSGMGLGEGRATKAIELTEPEPVELGKFPYPFQAAFTMSSDIDGSSVARFHAVHALFCGSEAVRPDSAAWQVLGLDEGSAAFDESQGGVPGLGLDFADSFFLIADKKAFGMYRPDAENGSFAEDGQEGLNCRELIQGWIKEGKIDAFHAFLHHPRRRVEPILKQFYQWCEEEGVAKPMVWTNHSYPVTPTGLCPRELQPSIMNRLVRLSVRSLVGPFVGRERFPLRFAFARYEGDWPGSRFYVNDILAANGLRYVWLNMEDLNRNAIAVPELTQNGRPTILSPVTMGDGVRYYRFTRCYGKPAGRCGGESYLRESKDGFDASCLITEKNLASLCQSGGTCIFYTHWSHARSMPIADETIARFQLLRRWRDSGKIWVTTTSRLLEWTRRRTFLRTVCRQEGRRLIVEIEGVDDPIFGFEPVSLADLNGLVLVVPQVRKELSVVVRNSLVPPDQVHRSGNVCWISSNQSSRLVMAEGASL